MNLQKHYSYKITEQKNSFLKFYISILIFFLILIFLCTTNPKLFFDTEQKITIKKFLDFPYIWITYTWIGSWFSHFFAFLFIYIFSEKNITKKRLKTIFVSAIFFTVLVGISAFVVGISSHDFINMHGFEYFQYTIGLLVQIIGYESIAILITKFSKSKPMSYVLYIGYLIIESIIRKLLIINKLSSIIYFFPAKSFSMLTVSPENYANTTNEYPIYVAIAISAIWIIIIWFLIQARGKKKVRDGGFEPPTSTLSR